MRRKGDFCSLGEGGVFDVVMWKRVGMEVSDLSSKEFRVLKGRFSCVGEASVFVWIC